MSNLKDRYAILKKRAHEKAAARKRAGTSSHQTNIRNRENSPPKPTIVKKKEKENEVLAVIRKGRGRRSKYTEEERKERHQERLKKNREAAQHSRNKKKKQMEDLEDRVKILSDENSMLKARIEELSTSHEHLKILEENRDLRRRVESLEALVKEKLEQPPVQQQPQPISILPQQQPTQHSQQLVQNKSNFHTEGAKGSQQKDTSPPPPPPPPPQESVELKMIPPSEAQSQEQPQEQPQEQSQQLPLPSPPLLVTRALRGATPEQGKHTITMKTKKRRRQQQLTGGEALYEMFAGASELRKNETAAFNFCKPLTLRSSDAPVSSVMTLFLVQFLTLLFASMINPREFGISLRPLNRHFWIQLCQVMTRYPNSLIHVWRKKELHSQNMMDIIKTLSLRNPRNHELLTTSNKLASFVVQSLSCAKEYIKSRGRRHVKRRKRRWGMHVFVG